MERELYLVRHAETLFNIKRMLQGWTDSPLTEHGVEQAERVGRYLAHEGINFDHAYASTLTRSQTTLEHITDMPYGREAGLREWYFGRLEGERCDILPDRPWGDFFVTYGGEGQSALRARMVSTLTEIMRRPGHGRVLAVGHGSACKEFRDRWNPELTEEPVPGNCSIMRYAFDGDGFALEAVIEQEDMRRALGE